MTDDLSKTTKAEVELLSFRLGGEEYSVDIMSVREIRGWTRATPLPHAPEYVRGVINLRATVLPVVDLSVRLGMPPITGDARNVIIVVQNRTHTAGLLVDAVSDILAVSNEALQAPPEIADDRAACFISALTIVENRMIRVLDLGAVLPGENSEAAA
ncbi:chemotaxis protein CheW [Pseudothioclava arenosa]|uniref:Chemotaxis protein CheW n=1 Tax=Pseudothioclava arenosa TaxID=1795308 RepID=A0A2A4CLQ0_9RHOB|nr:chemotaxis protein CheW [Pseudothioclava arenosa]PCD76923.1 chemotaxis protein CheW [Pseudothioclava arenosa]